MSTNSPPEHATGDQSAVAVTPNQNQCCSVQQVFRQLLERVPELPATSDERAAIQACVLRAQALDEQRGDGKHGSSNQQVAKALVKQYGSLDHAEWQKLLGVLAAKYDCAGPLHKASELVNAAAVSLAAVPAAPAVSDHKAATDDSRPALRLGDLVVSVLNPRHGRTGSQLETVGHGLAQPLVLRQRPDGYEVVIGSERFRALKAKRGPSGELAPSEYVVRNASDAELVKLIWAENQDRHQPSALEKARFLAQAQKVLKLPSARALAARFRAPKNDIAAYLRLFKEQGRLPELWRCELGPVPLGVHAYGGCGLTIGHFSEIIKLLPHSPGPLPSRLETFLEKVATAGWSVARLREKVQDYERAAGIPTSLARGRAPPEKPSVAAARTTPGTEPEPSDADAEAEAQAGTIVTPTLGLQDAGPVADDVPHAPNDAAPSANTVLTDDSPAHAERQDGPRVKVAVPDADAGWRLNVAVDEVRDLLRRLLGECPQAQQPAFAEAVQQMTERVLGGVAAEA